VNNVKLKGKRVAVTGGAGFIGSHLVDALLAADNEVVVIDDFSVGKQANIDHHKRNPRFSVERADVRDLEAMVDLTEGVDIVFHLACACLRSSLSDPLTSHEVNATGTLNMCQASLQNSVQRFIYTSSAEVYGNARYLPMDEDHPLNPTHAYGASKAAGELYALAYWRCYGLPSVVVRFFNVYGPRACCEGARAEVIPKFILRTMAGLPSVIFGTGEQSRSFVWVEDLIRGILIAAESDDMVGDCVQLGGPQEVTIASLCQVVLEKLGRTDLQPIHLDEGRPGDIGRSQADIGKARRILGFSPRVDIDTGLDKYIAWLQAQDIDLDKWVRQERVRNWHIARLGGDGPCSDHALSKSPLEMSTKRVSDAPYG
jgi:UDP-glucose 4-epimerase